MFFCRENHYPMITLEDLSGFTEDKRAAARFARGFWPLSLSSVAALLCFGVFIWLPISKGQGADVPHIYVLLAGVSFVVAIILFVVAWRRMVSSVPISPQSGQPMEVYQLEDTVTDGKYELVYLCRQSHTFFRIVFGASGD